MRIVELVDKVGTMWDTRDLARHTLGGGGCVETTKEMERKWNPPSEYRPLKLDVC